MNSGLGPERPFPGLRSYAAADHEWFFGREQQSLALYRLIDRGRFVAVVGSSGSGKSSVVRAGLTPLLEEETAGEGGRRWRWWEMRPGDAPISRLAETLAGNVEEGASDNVRGIHAARRERIDFLLRSSSFGLRDALGEGLLPANVTPLIIVDQFEELFRFADLPGNDAARAARREEAAAFVQLLLEATRSGESAIRIVLTMRSDYLGDCSRFHGLPEAVTAGEYLVPALTRDQRTQAICQPVEKAGASIADDLVERLLHDSSDELDQLPVLQHALMRTWNDAGSNQPRHLALENYETIGGVGTAISLHADELLDTPELRDRTHVVEQVFRGLSELDRHGRGVRRPLKFAQLVAESGYPDPEVREVVDRMRRDDCCFLVPPFDDDRPLSDMDIVDVGHEALIRRWTKMTREVGMVRAGWLIDEVSDGRTYVALLETAKGGIQGQQTSLPLDQVDTRMAWWESRPRTPAWAARYGGEIDSVKTLMSNSTLALKESVRKQEESKEVEVKLRREQARSKFRTRLIVAASSALVVMTGLIAGLIWQNGKVQEKMAEAQTAQSQLKEEKDKAVSSAKKALESAEVARGFATRAAKQEDIARQQENFAKEQKAIAETKSKELESLRHTAEKSAERARTEANAARSGELAANAIVNLPIDPELSLLLAMESAKIVPTPQSLSALRAALPESGIRRILRTDGEVNSVAYSPDGKLLAVSDNHKVRILEADTGKTLRVLDGHKSQVHLMVFSPDGQSIATEAGDQTGKVWEVSSGKVILPLEGLIGAYAAIAFSPDGQRIAAESGERDASVWDVKSGRVLYRVSHNSAIRMVNFSPDGELLVTASSDRTVGVWNTKDGTPIARLQGHNNDAIAAKFNQKGTHLVTASLDGTARIYATGKWDKALETVRHSSGSAIYDVRISPNESKFLTASDDRTARIWDFSGRQLQNMAHNGPVTTAAFTSDGRHVVTASGADRENRNAGNDRGIRGDNMARVWEVQTGRQIAQLRGHTGAITSLAVAPTGQYAVTGSKDNTVRSWATGIQTGMNLGPLISDEARPQFSPNGSTIIRVTAPNNIAVIVDSMTGNRLAELRHAGVVNWVALASEVIALTIDTGGLNVWDWKLEKLLFTHKGAKQAAFGRNGELLAIVKNAEKENNVVQLWNRDRHLHTIIDNEERFGNIQAVLSSDGKLALFYHNDRPDEKTKAKTKVTLWDSATNRKMELLGHEARIYSANFSRDGSLLVTASADKTARVWDAVSGELRDVLRGHTDEVNRAVFDPKGDRIVTTGDDNTARIWAWSRGKGKALLELREHDGRVFDARFSSDGKFLLTASSDGNARVWDTTTGNLIEVFRNQVRPHMIFDSAIFSPTGRRVMTFSRATGINIFECELCRSLEELTKLAQMRVTRPLTELERERYLRISERK
jgi:WD40 repeat protein/energy-coupling factor transporter ATP-binding protein EcfA2